MLSRCFLDCSVGEGVFVTGLSQISSFFSSEKFFVYQGCLYSKLGVAGETCDYSTNCGKTWVPRVSIMVKECLTLTIPHYIITHLQVKGTHSVASYSRPSRCFWASLCTLYRHTSLMEELQVVGGTLPVAVLLASLCQTQCLDIFLQTPDTRDRRSPNSISAIPSWNKQTWMSSSVTQYSWLLSARLEEWSFLVHCYSCFVPASAATSNCAGVR